MAKGLIDAEGNEEARRWAAQRSMTPKERYKLGHTNTWHPVNSYFDDIIPLWLEKTHVWSKNPATPPRLPPKTILFMLARGGILETNFIPMFTFWGKNQKRLYVRDSPKTRDILRQLQHQYNRFMAYRLVKIRLIQDTFGEGWLELWRQVIALKRKLGQPDWEDSLDGLCVNLWRHLKIGAIIDDGLMPPDLMIVCLRMITVHMQDYLRDEHPFGGKVYHPVSNYPQRVLVTYGHRQLVAHTKVLLSEFYRSNLYNAPARMVKDRKSYKQMREQPVRSNPYDWLKNKPKE